MYYEYLMVEKSSLNFTFRPSLTNEFPFIVYPDGKVCISILHPPGTDEYNNQESADERWRPILGVESIILSVISMLNDPNISSPANIDAAVEYRDNYDTYKKKVRKLTIQSVDSL
jgi:ubiquitin-conjugating enzyme E2 G1